MNTTINFGSDVVVNNESVLWIRAFESQEDAAAYVKAAEVAVKMVKKGDKWFVVLLGVNEEKQFLQKCFKHFGFSRQFAQVFWAATVHGCVESGKKLLEWLKSVPALLREGWATFRSYIERLVAGDSKTWALTLASLLATTALVALAVVSPIAGAVTVAVIATTLVILHKQDKLEGVLAKIDTFFTQSEPVAPVAEATHC